MNDDEMMERFHERFGSADESRPVALVVIKRDAISDLVAWLDESIEDGDWRQVRQIADRLRELR